MRASPEVQSLHLQPILDRGKERLLARLYERRIISLGSFHASVSEEESTLIDRDPCQTTVRTAKVSRSMWGCPLVELAHSKDPLQTGVPAVCRRFVRPFSGPEEVARKFVFCTAAKLDQ